MQSPSALQSTASGVYSRNQRDLTLLHTVDPGLVSRVDLPARSGFDRFVLGKARRGQEQQKQESHDRLSHSFPLIGLFSSHPNSNSRHNLAAARLTDHAHQRQSKLGVRLPISTSTLRARGCADCQNQQTV